MPRTLRAEIGPGDQSWPLISCELVSHVPVFVETESCLRLGGQPSSGLLGLPGGEAVEKQTENQPVHAAAKHRSPPRNSTQEVLECRGRQQAMQDYPESNQRFEHDEEYPGNHQNPTMKPKPSCKCRANT